PSTVVADFARQLQRSPKSVAATVLSKEYTYAQVTNDIRRIAYALKKQGVKTGDRVVVNTPNAYQEQCSMWAIWWIGAVYVPVSHDFPEDRKQTVISDCTPAVVLTAVDWELLGEEVFTEDAQSGPKQVAYLLYTSGSTGVPKGVAVSHGSLYQKLQEEAALYNLDASLVTYSLTRSVFDVSFLERVLPWMLGGRVVMHPLEDDVAATIANLIREKVTVLQGTPSYFAHWVTELTADQALALQTHLQHLCIGGESLPQALVTTLRKALPQVQINNHYGPTEATIDALVRPKVEEVSENLIGRPLGAGKAWVVDAHGKPVPPYFPGELLLGGPALAEGYWHDEEKTATKFAKLSGTDEPVFRSGDLACWNAEGEIRFLGRADQQVKFRGYRIELEEISSVLVQQSQIHEAAVQVWENQLVAWVVTQDLQEERVRAHMASKLPSYMQPNQLVVVDSLPRTHQGKINWQALPKPEISESFEEPVTDTETLVQSVWSSVLGLDTVPSRQANFFELGGDSLRLLKLQNALTQETGKTLEVGFLFAHPSLAEQAAELDTLSNNQEDLSSLLAPVQSDYPLSPEQHRLWALSHVAGGLETYNMPLLVPVDGSVEALTGVLQEVVDRYDIFRTTFQADEAGQPRQTLHAEGTVPVHLNTHQLKDQAALEAYVNEQLYVPFDLEAGPLFRGEYLTCEGQTYLYWCMHHIISDGVSVSLLVEEIRERLLGQAAKAKPTVQYKDYAYWTAARAETEAYQDDRTYWMSHLGDLETLTTLSETKTRPGQHTFSGEYQSINVSDATFQAMKELQQRSGISMNTQITAAYHALVARYTGQERVISGMPASGRPHQVWDDQPGCFVKTLPVVTTVSPGNTILEYLREVET
ncbi:MAG TPA: hypothetical protein DCR93_26465, partial [Cytophagales bacterium]|nr:hypothetical protein [Cytophagales bacterium]